MHLYHGYRNYDGARVQLTIAKRGLPNSAEASTLEGLIDRRQGKWENAVQCFKEALALDPRNVAALSVLAQTLLGMRKFDVLAPLCDRMIDLLPDRHTLKLDKAIFTTFSKTGDTSAVESVIAALPRSADADPNVVNTKLWYSMIVQDWTRAEQLIENMKGGEVILTLSHLNRAVPGGYYAALVARARKEPITNPAFAQARQQLFHKVLKSPQDPEFLSELAVLDALLENKETAIPEAKRAVEMLPVSKDAITGPRTVMNLAVVYAWTGELDLAFDALSSLTTVPCGIFYGELKCDPRWIPLHQDPRYEKLLAELAPND